MIIEVYKIRRSFFIPIKPIRRWLYDYADRELNDSVRDYYSQKCLDYQWKLGSGKFLVLWDGADLIFEHIRRKIEDEE